MRITPHLAILSALCLLLPSLAGAATEGGFNRTGPYIGGGMTYAFAGIFEKDLEDAFNVPTKVEPSFGAHGVLGYRMFSFLAAEVEYEWVDNFDIELLGTEAVKASAQTVTANLRLIAPIWRIHPYVLGGIGGIRWDFKDQVGLGLSRDDYALAARAGGGLDVYLTRGLVLNGGVDVLWSDQKFEAPTGTVDELVYVSAKVGLRYQFQGFFGLGGE